MEQFYSYTRTRFPITLILLFFIIPLACSLPDSLASSGGPTYRYDDFPEEGGDDAVMAEYQALSQWNRTDLTYFFNNDTERIPDDREYELVEQAFALWAAQTPLIFTEVSDAAQADILIGWETGEHGVGQPFDGPGDVLAHASYPNPYTDRQVFLFFDDDERWVDSATQDVDLLTVAAHEIGHTLGLGHSADRSAIMYASYSGPRRSLSGDDIDGIQSLYGAERQPHPAPQAPPPGATSPPSDDLDSDGDGISDNDEVLRTGTDPHNKDTDGDGLSDGVEVIYRMNPLDPDMDKDGASDGREVAAGTNPFFPDQSSGVSPELEREVSEFLTRVIELQIQAYRQGRASIAEPVLAGEIYDSLESTIAALNRQGLAQIAEIDYYQSYIDAIRVVDQKLIQVDTCEVWSTTAYRQSDDAVVESAGPELLPQTLTLQKLGANWFVTRVQFFDAPAFCQ